MEEGSKQNTSPVARAGEAGGVKHALWSNLQENVLGHSTARWVTNDGRASNLSKQIQGFWFWISGRPTDEIKELLSVVSGNCVWYKQGHLPLVTLASSCLYLTDYCTHLGHESSSPSQLCGGVADLVFHPLFFSVSSHSLIDRIHSHGLKYHPFSGNIYIFSPYSPDLSRLTFQTPTRSTLGTYM